MLSEINSHPRDSRISFNEPTHTYSIDGVSKNIMSVTTLIHKHFPHFDSDKVIDKLIQNGSEKYKGLSKDEIKRME